MFQCLIRPLATDVEAQACAALMAASEPWLTLGHDYPSLLRTMRAPGRELYLAHVDDRLAGFIILNLQGTFAGYIQTICIAPEHQGQGCGTTLIAFAEDRILRDHANVFLCVSSFNHAARRLYQRLGYAQVGELEDFLVAGHSELLLRKTRGPIASYRPQGSGLSPA